MSASDSPRLDPSKLVLVRDEMLRFFAEDDRPPIEVSESGLVTVTMDARFQVRAVSLYGAWAGAEARVLEGAIVVAINKAIAEVTRRNAERLSLAVAQAKE